MKLQRPREFKFEPYYYKGDEEEEQNRRIHFRRIRHSKRVPKANPVRLIFAIILLVFVIYMLQKKSNYAPGSGDPGRIQVEEIIIVD
jgi:hypothetical protein